MQEGQTTSQESRNQQLNHSLGAPGQLQSPGVGGQGPFNILSPTWGGVGL